MAVLKYGTVAFLVFVGVITNSPAAPIVPEIEDRVDWPEFLSSADPIWHRLPTKWEESPFLGNGWMGTMVYQNGDNPRQLRIDVHHAGVTDHQPGDGTFWTARLPIGYFTIDTVGEMTACDLRLGLWNAELTGSVTTTAGSFELRALVPAEVNLIAADVTPDSGEAGLRVTFHPSKAVSPRMSPKRNPKNYRENPPHEFLERGDVRVCQQPLFAGGEHATAWRLAEGETRRLLVSVAHSHPERRAVHEATETVASAWAQGGYNALLADHRAWWHEFYPQSFVSISDPFWQNFYAIQMYKLGASTRAEGCLIDNHGPWLQATPWPYATWNLNVQLSYWAFNASNHLREAASLPNHLSRCREQLSKNVVPVEYRHDSYVIGRPATEGLEAEPYVGSGTEGAWPGEGGEVGNLLWAMHNVWLQYRHTMDETLLRETLFPLLKGSVNYYLHFLEADERGVLHLGRTYSPEYGTAPDCNYDLSLIRWGCRTLLEINQRLDLNDEKATAWRDVLDHLTDYPGDNERGYHIGRGMPYTRSHRHYSHLLMIYPFYEINIDTPGGREQIEKCIANWHSLPKQLLGYSFTGSASMFAALGDGDRALGKLNGLRRFLQPNTMYREGGPVIETPLSAAQSIHDMLVQSWGDKIRVFPAMPSEWRDATIHKLRTEGAFELSAARRDGRTEWVRLRSLAGEPFEVQTGIAGGVEVVSDGKVDLIEDDNYRLELAAGQAVLFRRTNDTRPAVAPVLVAAEPQFGLPD